MQINILSSGTIPQCYEIQKDKISLGHDSSCDLQINEPDISRLHLDVISYEGRYFIHDNGSTNGTYCDDRKIDPGITIEIFEGTKLRLGASVLLSFTNKKAASNILQKKISDPIERTKVISLARLKEIKKKSVIKKRLNFIGSILAMGSLPYLVWSVINNL